MQSLEDPRSRASSPLPCTPSHTSPTLLLHGLAGRPIVVDAWITASSGAQTWVDPQLHLLEDRAAEEAFAFTLAASYERACHRLLLTDKAVFFTPGECTCQSSVGGKQSPWMH